ncbi:MAG: hypothetical protein P1U56_19730 [Saprospiraceae bacterium]|nr:hypothetical protein [Saprospiraceae bacterium]
MFNIFKKKKNEDSSSPALEDWLKAKEHYETGDYSTALSLLVGGFRKDIYYTPLYELSSKCLDKMGGKDESILFKNAIGALNASTFQQLGNHFYQVEHYPLTEIFLEESFKTNKDAEVGHNLAVAYARRFDTKKAQETLEIIRNKFDFWTYWFYVKMKILNNDKSNLEQSIKELEDAFDPNSNDENLIIPKQKVKELRESFERLQLVNQPEQKIRDWQFIQYGTLIMDFFYAEDQYVAGGRHVASWGNNEFIKDILHVLSNILKEKGIEKIVHANNNDSRIIGTALSKISNIPIEEYRPTNGYRNSLMLVSDSSGFNEFNNIEIINNQNITFSFNHNWLQTNYICPDIIGLMSQSYTYPWNGGNFKMNEDGTTSRTEPDQREDELIADEIAATELKGKVTIDAFYDSVKNDLKMNQIQGHRYNFMIESPVPGSYFGSN